MVALATRLRNKGVEVTIVTPSRAPMSLQFLLVDVPTFITDDPASRDPLERADAIAVLDTAEPKRLGGLPAHLERVGGVLIDHHPVVGDALVEPSIRDPSACATGELVFDLLSLDDCSLNCAEAEAIYVALVTDTGSFQFSNTSSRTHAIVAELIDAGVDPGAMYRALYGGYTRGKLALVSLALENLEVDPLTPIAWVALDHRALFDTGATGEDMEGLVEYPRRLKGIEVGLFFRGLSRDRTKVSLRSNDGVNVSEVAQMLGGGGHAKASGIVLDVGLAEAVRTVVEELRPHVDALINSKEAD